MRGKDTPDLTDDELKNIINSVVLSGADVEGTDRIGEILVANWKIDKWFCMAASADKLWPRPFWKKAKEVGIKKPIVLVSNMNYEVIDEIHIDDYKPDDK